jgi:3-phosphoshikimate 1-carboxyvinyltransferase
MEAAFRSPGDKSIAHRALFLAALADGRSEIGNIPGSGDLASTRSVLEALGTRIEPIGPGRCAVGAPTEWRAPAEPLECGNSATTARLVAGLLVGLGLPATLRGDGSLSRRPMDRVVYPLQAMGGRIRYGAEAGRLPIVLEPRSSGALRVLRYRSRVASAQVKSALLLAALASDTEVEVREPAATRDHTERLLAALGAPVEFGPLPDGGARARLARRPAGGKRRAATPLPGFELELPGDISSAAFLVAAALLTGRRVRIGAVGLNPTRTGVLDVLRGAGARIEARVEEERLGEPVGTIEVERGAVMPLRIGADAATRCIDEIPVLAVLAARAPGITEIEGAAELRVKESDRLTLVAENLRALGVTCEERRDGLRIEGSDRPLAGRVRTDGDHRIAMAFGVLGAAPDCEVEVDDPGAVDVSYPEFWRDLARLVGEDPR